LQPASDELLLAEFANLQARLNAVGAEVTSTAALAQFEPSPAAQRVLARALSASQHHLLREFIARALTEPKLERDVFAALVAAFEDELHPIARWAIGNAVATAATNEDVDKLLELVSESGYGIGRQMIVLRLERWAREQRVDDVLISLTHDEDVYGHAATALGGAASQRALDALDPLMTCERKWIQTAARKSAARVEKRLTRGK
jgi:hypothetical protein